MNSAECWGMKLQNSGMRVKSRGMAGGREILGRLGSADLVGEWREQDD